MRKILVAYFSASGVTARAAKTLADVADADLYEIKPKVPYTQKDLDWMNPLSRSSKEMKGQSAYPELADQSADIQAHSVIMIGFPIWWYIAPTIINRFLESYDFSGKENRIICYIRRKWFWRNFGEIEKQCVSRYRDDRREVIEWKSI